MAHPSYRRAGALGPRYPLEGGGNARPDRRGLVPDRLLPDLAAGASTPPGGRSDRRLRHPVQPAVRPGARRIRHPGIRHGHPRPGDLVAGPLPRPLQHGHGPQRVCRPHLVHLRAARPALLGLPAHRGPPGRPVRPAGRRRHSPLPVRPPASRQHRPGHRADRRVPAQPGPAVGQPRAVPRRVLHHPPDRHRPVCRPGVTVPVALGGHCPALPVQGGRGPPGGTARAVDPAGGATAASAPGSWPGPRCGR